MSFTLTDSVTLITLEPEYDYKDKGSLIEARHRVRDGGEFRYKFGQFDHFDFSIKYVSSSDADTLNQWWSDATSLFYDADGTLYMVRLSNTEKPVGERIAPYTDIFKGTIVLETM